MALEVGSQNAHDAVDALIGEGGTGELRQAAATGRLARTGIEVANRRRASTWLPERARRLWAGLRCRRDGLRRGLVIILVTAATVAGCAREDVRSDGAASMIRFLDREGDALLDADVFTRLDEESPVFVWDFEDPRSLDGWRAFQIDRQYEIRDGRLVIESSATTARLHRTVSFSADDVQAIRVSFSRPVRSDVELFWVREGERYSPQRRIAVGQQAATPNGEYQFDLASHPLWSGDIQQIRLDPTANANEIVELVRVVGLKRTVIDDGLARTARDAWKVVLGRDVRDAWVTPPGAARRRAVSVGPDAQLRFAYGAYVAVRGDSTARQPLRFRVVFEETGGSVYPLFDEEHDSEADATRWVDVAIDLADVENRVGELVFEATTATPWNPLHGVPLWANPEIVPVTASADRPNIVLISLDTLRADRLSLYGYERPTSPSIDAWANRVGVTFEHAIVQAPWTLPSHVSMLTGMDALSHGVNQHDDHARSDLMFLAEVLREAGYSTLAVTGGAFLHPRYGLAQGFDSFVYWGGGDSAGADSDALPFAENAEEMRENVDRALAWLDSRSGRPFFLFFHTYEVHAPFRRIDVFPTESGGGNGPQTGFANLRGEPRRPADGFVPRALPLWHGNGGGPQPLLPDVDGRLDAAYDGGVSYADAQVGRLLNRLQELGLEENTIVVLTSDHGEMLGEHDEFGHGGLHEEVIRVPLVFAYPDQVAGGRTAGSQVRSIDIFPTLLDLAGVSVARVVDGTSLRPFLVDERPPRHPVDAWTYAANANRGVSLRRGNRLKYVFNNTALAPVRGEERLYDLRDDVAEERNLAGTAAMRPDMRSDVEDKLTARPGIRLHFVNRGTEEFSGAVRGRLLHPLRIKSSNLACDCVGSEGGGRTTYRVPPGHEYTLVLEPGGGREADGLVFDGRLGQTTFDATVVPSANDVWSISYDGAAWRASTANDDPVPDVGIGMWWQGASAESSSPSDVDQELLQRLRMLGYVR